MAYPVPNPAPITPAPATLRDFVAMARPSHWVKHLFIAPGIVLAYLLKPTDPANLAFPVALGLVSAAAMASANYVLNEWLDAAHDAHHPEKSKRPAVTKRMSPALVGLEYALLVAIAVVLGGFISKLFLWTVAALFVSGLTYNVRPVRTKDRAYLDVISEAANNPIRLTLGWAMVDSTTLPPSSLLFAYWMGGAFLMGIKRFAEYRTVSATSGTEALSRYRLSFRTYTENRLLISSFLYAQLAAFFLAVFLIKYRVEYLLSLPVFALLFTSYLRIGLKDRSTAQAPERLFREKTLVGAVVLLVLVLAVLTVVDLPILQRLYHPHYIELD